MSTSSIPRTRTSRPLADGGLPRRLAEEVRCAYEDTTVSIDDGGIIIKRCGPFHRDASPCPRSVETLSLSG